MRHRTLPAGAVALRAPAVAAVAQRVPTVRSGLQTFWTIFDLEAVPARIGLGIRNANYRFVGREAAVRARVRFAGCASLRAVCLAYWRIGSRAARPTLQVDPSAPSNELSKLPVSLFEKCAPPQRRSRLCAPLRTWP
jgi:hypothetical protein